MQAYTDRDSARNPVVSFTLQRQQPRTSGDLDAWVTRALAGMKPWVVDLRARLARAWAWHTKETPHPHSKERQRREDQLRRDLAEHARLKGGVMAQRLPGGLGRRATAVLHQVARLLHEPTWYSPRAYVDQRTGEVKETIYLPEDTWSAQTALHWCIERLRVLVRAAWGMTEKVTPASSRREPPKLSGGRKEAFTVEAARAWVASKVEKYGGAQPDLPATG